MLTELLIQLEINQRNMNASNSIENLRSEIDLPFLELIRNTCLNDILT